MVIRPAAASDPAQMRSRLNQLRRRMRIVVRLIWSIRRRRHLSVVPGPGHPPAEARYDATKWAPTTLKPPCTPPSWSSTTPGVASSPKATTQSQRHSPEGGREIKRRPLACRADPDGLDVLEL